jgi:hypothetical protein
LLTWSGTFGELAGSACLVRWAEPTASISALVLPLSASAGGVGGSDLMTNSLSILAELVIDTLLASWTLTRGSIGASILSLMTHAKRFEYIALTADWISALVELGCDAQLV